VCRCDQVGISSTPYASGRAPSTGARPVCRRGESRGNSRGVKSRCSISATASASPRPVSWSSTTWAQRPCRKPRRPRARPAPHRIGAKGAVGIACHPDQRDAKAPRMGDDVGKFGRLAGIGEHEDHIARAIMPRSPWLASAGCTKCAGVPVEAKVAAILRRNMARLAHARHDDPAPRLQQGFDRAVETVIQRASNRPAQRPRCGSRGARVDVAAHQEWRRCRSRASRPDRGARVLAGNRSRPAPDRCAPRGQIRSSSAVRNWCRYSTSDAA
jgi:hypothetical protein